ncbi:MAG: sulfatase-like hydrolase/transferase [Labilithrix sp.]|nr:sulfatase-like hydrolase/transferase [Labilithrix sp.]
MAALVLWTVDLISWPSVRRPEPIVVSAALSIAVGIAGGALLLPLWLAVGLARARRRYLVAGAPCALVVGLAAWQGLETGASSRPATATVALAACASLAMTAVWAWGLCSAATLARRRRVWAPALVLALASAALLAIDRGPIVEKKYSFLEGLAQLGLTLSFALVLRAPRAARTRSRITTAVRGIAIAGIAWVVVFGFSRSLRDRVERTLPAVWEEPVYAARWLRRIRRVETLVGASTHDRLAQKFELPETLLIDDVWNAATAARDDAPALPPNVVVFFVDALRSDVAHDPSVMPETLAWMRDNLWFSRAYASGSSTLLTLAPMMGCRYDATPADQPRLLDAARAADMKAKLVIPSSAADYHRNSFPAFRFDEEEVVDDAERVAPTANALVDRSLTWLRSERPERFFLWLYQYDVHSWSDLEEAYVDRHATEAGFSKVDGLPRQYLAAARGVDQAFTRLRAGLHELGLTDRTVILFVSDHGEGLGQQSFWAHTTYLWESLLRVPLALQVPGAAARASHDPVSTIDVGATLMGLMQPPSTPTRCHGKDLLSPETLEPRRHPILFSAVVDGELARVGMLGGAERKVVLDLRDHDARLLRVGDQTLEEDVSSVERDVLAFHLGQLIRTPIYPRQ